MDTPIIDPNAPLPTLLRGLRALYGGHSLRELSRLSTIHVGVLSRAERGLALPTVELLFRWSAGLNDGRPQPDSWATLVFAAAATWPDEVQFLLARYSDPTHDPEVCWSLACQATAIVAEGRKALAAEPPPAVVESWATYVEVGAGRYIRFTSLFQGDAAAEAGDAQRAAWFVLWRQASAQSYAAASRFLGDWADDEEGEPSLPLVLFVWLAEVWTANGQSPMRVAANNRKPDPQLDELIATWPRLSRPARDALVVLSRQLVAK